jgi:hypothetical protein
MEIVAAGTAATRSGPMAPVGSLGETRRVRCRTSAVAAYDVVNSEHLELDRAPEDEDL